MTKVTVNQGDIVITGTKYKILKIEGTNQEKIKELRGMLGRPPACAGGTYWPDPYSMLGALSCLNKMYYEPGMGTRIREIIKVEGETEKIPYSPVPGRRY